MELQRQQALMAEILGIINNPVAQPHAIQSILGAIKHYTGLDAVGMRLERGGDYPFVAHDGLSKDFLTADNSLVFHGEDGETCTDSNGKPLLACVCGRLLSGQTEPALPFSTPAGSAWTNDSTTFFNTLPAGEAKGKHRPSCIHEGFLSIALIPVRVNQELVGLLLLADRKPDGFNPSRIEFLELIINSISVVLARNHAEEIRLRREALLNTTQQMAGIGGWEWDCIHETLFWTEETWRIHEFDVEATDCVGTHLFNQLLDCYLPDDRIKITEALRLCVEKGLPYDFELPFITARGRKLWVRTCAQAVMEAGRTVRVIGQLMDITERKQIDMIRQFLINTISSQKGTDFFRSLARYLGENLEMDYVCIDKLEGDGHNAKMVAAYYDGNFTDCITYRLKDTPCGEVVGKSICSFDSNVRNLFPLDEPLQKMKAESYMGTTLWDASGEPIGLMALIGRKPLADSSIAAAILELAAIPAASALERELAAEKFANIATIPFENPNPIYRIDTKGIVIYSNPAGMDLLSGAGSDIGEPAPAEWQALAANVFGIQGIQSCLFEHAGRVHECTAVRGENREYVNMYLKDFTERRKAEEKIQKENQLYEALAGIHEPMMRSKISMTEIANLILKWALRLCDCSQGFVSLIQKPSGETIVLSMTDSSGFTYNRIGDELGRRGFPLSSHKAFYSNDASSHPTMQGLPERHFTIGAYLSVPVILDDEIAGQIALANPAKPFTDDDLDAVHRLADYYSIAIKRKQDDDELKRSEKRFRSVIENIDEFIYSVDYQNGKPVNTYHSPKSRNITGYDPEDFAADSQLMITMIHEDDRESIIDYMEGLKAGKGFPPVEHRIIRKDGTLSWVLNTCTAEFSDDGELLRTQGFVIDMNERILMEHKLLEARNAAEEANRAKSDFLASMSHELRTPLNSILGFSQLLSMDESGSLNENQRSFLQDIRASGEHLLSMIGDILDLAKIEAGKVELQTKPFNLADMLETLVETMRAPAGEKLIRINVGIQADIGILDADEVRVRQIFYNLLSNAIKFTGHGKNIGLEARGDENRAVITIWDEGIGIAEEDQTRIFNPFEQVRQMENTHQGTGLGLSITQRLVELHGGHIEIQSVTGRGSRFTVILPGRKQSGYQQAVPANAEPLLLEEEDAALGPYEILVVEDNPVNQKLIIAILATFGFEGVLASSGEQAVELAQSRLFNIILMDINLPGIDGIEAMKRIRRSATTRIPFIALTAHTMKGDHERFIAEGMDDVVSKPIDIQKLKTTLAKYLAVKEMPASIGRPAPARQESESYNIGAAAASLSLGTDDLQSLIDYFYSGLAAAYLAEIAVAIEKDSYPELAASAHKLRGTVANLRFESASATLKEIEMAAKASSNIDYRKLYARLEREIHALEVQLCPKGTTSTD